jgi:hypothetical protein
MPGGLFLILFASATALAIFILMLSDVWKAVRAKIVTPKRSCDFPCRNCRFFTSNRYLWCTVHPSIVLTQQAIDCADYSP